MLGDGALVVGVAGEGEGRIRQREDVAAVAGAVAVGHGLGNGHGDDRLAGCDGDEFHAEMACGVVVVPHRPGAGFGKHLRGKLGGAHLPENSGLRFSRKAETPSA